MSENNKTLTEKIAYLKGLADGKNLNTDTAEGSLISALLDIVDELAHTVEDMDESLEIISDQVDAVDEDLSELESVVYDDDDCDCGCCDDDDDYYEVECPNCKEIICVDEDILEDGSINCPNCNTLLEFDIEEEEDD